MAILYCEEHGLAYKSDQDLEQAGNSEKYPGEFVRVSWGLTRKDWLCDKCGAAIRLMSTAYLIEFFTEDVPPDKILLTPKEHFFAFEHGMYGDLKLLKELL
jgi:hypothetical protein